MTIELYENFEQTIDFLIDHSGVTCTIINEISRKKYRFSHLLFKPMKNPMDLRKLYSPIIAPIALSILSLVYLAEMLSNLVLGLYYLLTEGNSEEFSITMSFVQAGLLPLAFALIATVASPIVNLVDLIGSSVSTGINLLCTKKVDMERENLIDSSYSGSDSESTSLVQN